MPSEHIDAQAPPEAVRLPARAGARAKRWRPFGPKTQQGQPGHIVLRHIGLARLPGIARRLPQTRSAQIPHTRPDRDKEALTSDPSPTAIICRFAAAQRGRLGLLHVPESLLHPHRRGEADAGSQGGCRAPLPWTDHDAAEFAAVNQFPSASRHARPRPDRFSRRSER